MSILFFGSRKYCVDKSRFLIPTVNVYSYNETVLLSVMEVLSGIDEPIMLLTRTPGISNNGFKNFWLQIGSGTDLHSV